MEKIIIGSGNKNKIKEIKDFFSNLKLDFVGLPEDINLPPVIEDGSSYRENALKKARQRSKELQQTVLADDSGLSVDYLDGAPGIYSARFAGEESSDKEKYLKIISLLKDSRIDERKAAFVSAVALVDPQKGDEIVVEGRVEGVITLNPAGDYGFGYDPIFYLPEYGKTMAQLSPKEKNKISHRAKALKKMKEVLIQRYLE
ncbi:MULTISPECIES: XTP/dITP diphosphatase [unclassified Halanaerobium]|uniref:XTP/dITP diphosphatase n=1 Tax=unclassified Halanaerobium TaxID=2641197 RepID=UPI000DF16224|nr:MULTISPECIES: XTP/dITP diphosphatase [unclassified Halanaerobium]RCW41834.1 XTP/dITP diphosphohydrolase [Halanaerobium sp. MA284_MarDTE_T2]RCW88012.1 XTP/dITP diphosphohydrolase [Halanaerobium sp. DL-01]